jgi:hypothetical protein
MPPRLQVTCDGPAWETMPAIVQANQPVGSRRTLRGALLTSYETPDSAVLVEDLLPEWLGLERPFAEESGDARYLFFTELDRSLKALKGNLSVFCSANLASENGKQAYPWLFRYIRCYGVGKTGPATQHAKLWLLHWAAADDQDETLEIVISSCNLTRDALRGQIQAGWRAVIPLGSRSVSRQQRWGGLPDFLDALGRASAADGTGVVRRWIGLLSRAEPPGGALFVASVPGRYTPTQLRSQPWGMAGLRKIVPWANAEIDVVVPTVGPWNTEAIANWAEQAGVCERMRLAWPPKSATEKNPDATAGMSLSLLTHEALKKAGVEVLAWPPEGEWRPLLHPQQREADTRWPHCKLYWFSHPNRKETMLLVTSANLSQAAWGRWQKKRLRIENFELGVAFPAWTRPFRRLVPMEGKPHLAENPNDRKQLPISWADACWDGRQLQLSLRLDGKVQPCWLKPTLILDGRRRSKLGSLKYHKNGRIYRGQTQWSPRKGIPASIELEVTSPKGRDILIIPVADIRAEEAVWKTPCPEIPQEWRESAEVRMILEQYGGALAEDESTAEAAANGETEFSCKPADYRVEIIEAARRNWRVLNCWQEKVDATQKSLRGLLLRDACILRDYWRKNRAAKKWKSTSALAAELAARECDFRIRRAKR